MMQKNKSIQAHLTALITVLIWGLTFISTKVLLRDFRPIEILFIRFIIGYIGLWIAHPHRLRLATKKHELCFALAGLCGVTLYYLLENIALSYTFASNVGVISSVAPFFTALLAWLLLKEEQPSIRFFIGFLFAMAGVCLLSFQTENALKLSPRGDFLALLSTVAWAFYSIFAKKLSSYGYNAIQMTRRIFFYGLLFMLPCLFLFKFRINLRPLLNWKTVLNLLFLGFGASALCFASWNYAIKILGSVKTSSYIYLIPVITSISSALILHEKFSPMSLIGIALTLSGLLISESKGKKQLRLPK